MTTSEKDAFDMIAQSVSIAAQELSNDHLKHTRL